MVGSVALTLFTSFTFPGAISGFRDLSVAWVTKAATSSAIEKKFTLDRCLTVNMVVVLLVMMQ
jgi:hypothetical protein